MDADIVVGWHWCFFALPQCTVTVQQLAMKLNFSCQPSMTCKDGNASQIMLFENTACDQVKAG
jgi:hypothetical protein